MAEHDHRQRQVEEHPTITAVAPNAKRRFCLIARAIRNAGRCACDSRPRKSDSNITSAACKATSLPAVPTSARANAPASFTQLPTNATLPRQARSPPSRSAVTAPCFWLSSPCKFSIIWGAELSKPQPPHSATLQRPRQRKQRQQDRAFQCCPTMSISMTRRAARKSARHATSPAGKIG